MLVSKCFRNNAVKCLTDWGSYPGQDLLLRLAFSSIWDLRAIGAKKMFAVAESFGQDKQRHKSFVEDLIARCRMVDEEWTIYAKHLVHTHLPHPRFPGGAMCMLDKVENMLKSSTSPLAEYPLLMLGLHWYVRRQAPKSAKAQRVWSYFEKGFADVILF